ncbi:MAG: anhydro-N-acetylmuramic acid kinase [Xanthomonadales bacterium]|nr:anhydro-N-acetylmuramic acid kinase [Xanthomonadales bacterium]
MADELFLGLISGTSADAIDVALVDFSSGTPTLVGAHAQPYESGLRQGLLELAQGDGSTRLDEVGALDTAVADAFAAAAVALLAEIGIEPHRVRALGSHGQTVWHRPHAQRPFSLQLGDPSRIAERSGCTVVADFRRRDLAAGGQGAPLLCALHAAVLACPDEDRAVLNLGGIANLTLLPADPGQPVTGFDTGPASGLLDAWAQRHLGTAFDRDGAFAARGQSRPELLARWLDEPYFALPAPKSTGREVFNLDWLSRRCELQHWSPADVQASLVSLTATTVAQALAQHMPGASRVLACGGGVHNPVLMAALQQALAAVLPAAPAADRRAPVILETTAAHGIDPDYMEAMGFAWLARETLAGRPGNLPAVTGARGPRILGGIYPA